MTGLAVALVMQTSLLGADATYAEAYQDAQQTGRPLVVLVGADWCPHCVRLKNDIIPVVRKRGEMDHVVFVALDADDQPKTARKIMTGRSLPQLVMYRKSGSEWQRYQLTGAPSADKIASFLQQGAEVAETAQTASRSE